MECPVCEVRKFERTVLDGDLNAFKCGECGGHWVNSFQYWLWKDALPQNIEEIACSGTYEVQDVIATKECPECGNLLQRYHVGHGTSFTIDRCEKCRGIWLDKNEWEILREKNLHDDIHFIFSQQWQKQARDEKLELSKEAMFEKYIGKDGVAKLKEFKAWYKSQKEQSMILAYLNN